MAFLKKVCVEQTVIFKFGNGHEVNISLDALSNEMYEMAALHGLSQKIGDSASGAKGDYAFAIAAVESTRDAILSGQWNRVRESSLTDLVEACLIAFANVDAAPKDEVGMTAMVEGWDKKKRDAVRKFPTVKVELDRLALERSRARAASADVPTDLADLF